ncbi:MAG: hypothetical protein H0T73_22175 [Ardenticatenales bacterium]|nr:hypothetical protein [Ardenticatenales bacterium]
MNVMVITEDHTYDQQMLKPILREMLASVDKPRANLRFYQNSKRRRGYEKVKSWEFLEQVFDQNRLVHLFLLIVDRDGVLHRRADLDDKETRAANREARVSLLSAHAFQEIEAWILIGQDNLPWPPVEIRNDVDVKERFYYPFVEREGLMVTPGQGRAVLAQRANYIRIKQFCEEVRGLEERVRISLEP